MQHYMKKLPPEFYQRTNVLAIAEELLGKLLVTRFDGETTSGRIVETEAYNGVIDRASHAYGGRRTSRTEVMFGTGGTAYVYLCYGIHHLFNVVTNTLGTPHAVLIRGVEPVQGKEIMMRRMNKARFDNSIGRGPGNVSRALGIYKQHTGFSLNEEQIWIADDSTSYSPSDIIKSPRIGVDYAGEDALLHYRFYIKDNPFVSGRNVTGKKTG